MVNTMTAVLGAGSWGTAIAMLLARNGHQTQLWSNEPEQVLAMNQQHCNPKYLPDISFPDKLQVTDDLAQVMESCQDIIIGVPSHAFRSVLLQIKPFINDSHHFCWLTKGLDPATSQLLHHVFEQELGSDRAYAVLSGPSFAKEVAIGLPTAVCIASNSPSFSHDLLQKFHSENFRVYSCEDIIGVQLGGTVKNVIAIATGISDGLGLGANTRAALITRGLAEIRRLGAALQAHPETFMGLSGVGDLVLTCTDDQSRNRRFGLAVGKGLDSETAQKDIGQVVEGAQNAFQVMTLAEQHSVEMPITKEVCRIINGEVTAKQAVHELLARAPKHEE